MEIAPHSSQQPPSIRRAVDLALDHFTREGFNCAESVLYGVMMAFGLPGGDAILRAATPFGGGIGRAGCVCGALSGAIMALGLHCGRTSPDAGQRNRAYARAERLWRRFVERAGGEDCRDINTLGFNHPDHKDFCARFVAMAAELAAEEIARSKERGAEDHTAQSTRPAGSVTAPGPSATPEPAQPQDSG